MLSIHAKMRRKMPRGDRTVRTALCPNSSLPSHGTAYERIMGKKPYELTEDEIPEVIRDAVFQEPEVEEVQEVSYTMERRSPASRTHQWKLRPPPLRRGAH